ncbi:MAG: immune inhibitor A [Crocinitomicaceae bacterium]|nr:immune inhibitor A [Crocinitomicaceae bacterium]
MKKLLVFIYLGLLSVFTSNGQELYSRVKIYGTDEQLNQAAQMGVAMDHGQHKRDMWFITDLSETEIQILENNGFTYEILIDDVSAYYVANSNAEVESTDNHRSGCGGSGSGSSFNVSDPANWQLGSMAGFYTYQEFLDELDSMASKYPNIISVKSPISTFTSIEGRPILWVRISDNPNSDEAEEEVLYTSLHHSREPASLSQLIFYMWWMLENYTVNDEVTYLIDETEMYFVPMINPDGYVYNETTNPGGGGMHRKNRRNIGTTNKGVDLNRNYSYDWCQTGGSMTPNNDTYCGSAAFSEPETQAIKWFCENHDFQFAFNAHTHGNLLLFPYGYDQFVFAPDHDYLQTFTNHMVIYNGYAAIKSSDLYPASGDSDDYMYAADLGVKPKIFAMTPECSSEGTANDFWPPQAAIHDICSENIWMNKTLAHMPHIYGVVTDLDPNQITTTTGYFHYEIQRLGLENGDITVSISPITGIQSVGISNVHTLNVMDIEDDSISYILDAGIAFGDEVKYELLTDNGTWIRRDTITKIFGAPTVFFSDDCNDLTNWSGDWELTTEDFVSPSNCITDSPFTDYNDNVVSDIELMQSFTFESATYAFIQFNAKWSLENDYDYVQFMASIDGGTSWTPLCGEYTNIGGSNQDNGNPLYDNFQLSWVLEEISLTDYLGMTDVRFKFLLVSDGGVTEDGFYFDDFTLFTDQIDNSGLGENNTLSWMVYPNPASQSVMIQFNQTESIQQVEITNELGELIYVFNPVNNLTHLSTEDWNNGVYFIKVISADQKINTKRFVVLK